MTTTCGEPCPGGTCALPPHRRGYHDPAPPTLIVPRNSQGYPQVSISQYRRYGAVDLLGTNAEEVRGCPRAYALTYGHGETPELVTRPSELGTVLHSALHLMETDAIGPEDALGRVWSPSLTMPDYADAVEILLGYLDRGGPLNRYATIATELDVTFELYVDDDFGPVHFRGIIDNVSIDPNDENETVARVIDHKSAARPVERESLRGDVQLLGYDWLIRQWWAQKYGTPPDRVVCYLDLLRYRDLAHEYSKGERDLWHAWACAMARTMLRDTAPAPILNDGCTWCAVRFGCPAWQALPDVGESMRVRMSGRTPRQLAETYPRASMVSKLLKKQVDDLRGALDQETHAAKTLRIGEQIWTSEEATKVTVDPVAVADLLLPDHEAEFRLALNGSGESLKRAGATLDPSLRDDLLNCASRAPAGKKVSRKKAPAEEETV
jgi:hypothetical protein